jgi:hypothetical protein
MLWITHQLLFFKFEIKKRINQYTDARKEYVIELVDVGLVEGLPGEEGPDAEPELGYYVQHVLVEGEAD